MEQSRKETRRQTNDNEEESGSASGNTSEEDRATMAKLKKRTAAANATLEANMQGGLGIGVGIEQKHACLVINTSIDMDEQDLPRNLTDCTAIHSGEGIVVKMSQHTTKGKGKNPKVRRNLVIVG